MNRSDLKNLLAKTMEKRCGYCGKKLETFVAHRPHLGITPEHLEIRVSCPVCECSLDCLMGAAGLGWYDARHLDTGSTLHCSAAFEEVE